MLSVNPLQARTLQWRQHHCRSSPRAANRRPRLMSVMASSNSSPAPPPPPLPPPLPPPRHPSPSPLPPSSPGQPLAPRTEDKSSSVPSEVPAGPVEKSIIPVNEPPSSTPSPFTVDYSPGPPARAIEMDQSSSPGPPPPHPTEVDKSSLGTQGASGFTAGDTSFVTPVENPQVPLFPPCTL